MYEQFIVDGFWLSAASAFPYFYFIPYIRCVRREWVEGKHTDVVCLVMVFGKIFEMRCKSFSPLNCFMKCRYWCVICLCFSSTKRRWTELIGVWAHWLWNWEYLYSRVIKSGSELNIPDYFRRRLRCFSSGFWCGNERISRPMYVNGNQKLFEIRINCLIKLLSR